MKLLPDSKIGKIFSLPYILISFFTFFVVASLGYYIYSLKINNIRSIESELVKSGSIQINNYVNSILQSLKLASEHIPCIQCEASDNKETVNNLITIDPSILSVSIVDKEGKEIEKAVRFSLEEPVLLDISDKEVFKRGIDSIYLSSVYVSEYGLPVIDIGMPIIDISNIKIGALVAHIDLSPMWGVVSNIKIGETGYAYIVDDKGLLISYKNINDVKNNLVINYSNIFKGNHQVFLKSYKSFTNQIVIGDWRRIDLTNWLIVVEQPISEIFYLLLPFIIGISLLLILLFVIFRLFLVNVIFERLVNPIKELKKGIEELKSGNLFYKIPSYFDDELGDLTKNFNSMNAEIREARYSLEEAFNKIRDEEARLIASINSLSIGFIIINNRGEVLIYNSACEKILLSNTCSSFEETALLMKDSFDLKSKYKEALENNIVIDSGDVSFKDKFLRIIISPVIVERKIRETIGAIISLEDITERKRIEQSKTDFLAVASHEMRTPLSIIRGSIELVLDNKKETNLSEDEKGLIERAHSNAIRLLEIINDFIDVVKIEGGSFRLDMKDILLAPLVKDVIQEFETMVSNKKIYLKLEDYKELDDLIVYGDKERIRQVLFNIISNAVHYTNRGGITIKIEEAEDKVKVKIIDTGIGIPKEKQDFLFKKFSTVIKTFLTTKEYGSGLGLYISKILMNYMHGEVGLEKSVPDEGSTFYIVLNRYKDIK